MSEPKAVARLWRNDPATPEGKYLVKRRDGSVVEHPTFVLVARDPAAVAALLAYAEESQARGRPPEFVADVYALAERFRAYRDQHGDGDPTERWTGTDDHATIAEMARGGSA